MTEYTGRFEFEKPSENGYYNIEEHARNLDKINRSAVKGTGVAEIKVLTKTNFDNAEKSDEILYIVIGESDFSLYLGNKPIKGGSSLISESMLSSEIASIGSVHNTEIKEEI